MRFAALVASGVLLAVASGPTSGSTSGANSGATTAAGRDASRPAAAPPLIAAAANLNFALEDLLAEWRRAGGPGARVSYGSSGNLARQIEQGAPFELFLSADEALVERLAARGRTRDAGRVYATGRIALLVPAGSPLAPDPELAGLARLAAAGGRWRFAIANPEHAPFGVAAREALVARGLWDAVEPRLVLGENVAQAAQFALGGDTVGGIVAYSLVLAPALRERSRHVLLPESLHAPLRMRMALVHGASADAEGLYAFLQSPAARVVLERWGFGVPAP